MDAFTITAFGKRPYPQRLHPKKKKITSHQYKKKIVQGLRMLSKDKALFGGVYKKLVGTAAKIFLVLL